MIQSLAYLGLSSPKFSQWLPFAEQVLGLQRTNDGSDGALRFRMDDAECRLNVHPGPKDDISYIGWDLPGRTAAKALADSISGKGIDVTEATPEEAASRRVDGFFWHKDLVGFRHELSWGQWQSPRTFRPGRAMSGFSTADQGMGHIVLLVPDLKAADEFYRTVMGFKPSDRIFIEGRLELLFYHVNGRHHSLAIGRTDGSRGAHHLMLEVGSMDDLGMAYDLCIAQDIPITSTIGRHSNDRMISFYMQSPSGLRIEYGWGGRAIDDLWSPRTYGMSSIWGHHKQHLDLPDALVINDTE